MAEPIVFISRLRLRDGAADPFAAMFRNAVAAIADSKPRTALFSAYLDADRTEVAIIHVFPDAAAMADHFEGSDDRAGTIADLVEYESAAAAYELVIVFYLQVPAGERRGILRRAAAAVASGGTFLLVGHDLRNLASGHGGPKDASVLYLAEDVAADLDGTGLEVERAEPVERTVETPEGERVAIDALVRAHRPA